MNSRRIAIAVVAAVCVLVLIGLALRDRMTGSQGSGATQTGPALFDEAQSRAFAMIEQREQWPESAAAVCKAFWEARATKNYAEMEILWPGSASFDWPAICKNDSNVEYVFGRPAENGTTVPYAAKDHLDARGTYNLTMRLGVLQTEKGGRYYIISGN